MGSGNTPRALDKRHAAEQPAVAPRPEAGRTYTSSDLFGAASEITIAHAQTVYRLRITRQGKLILNK